MTDESGDKVISWLCRAEAIGKNIFISHDLSMLIINFVNDGDAVRCDTTGCISFLHMGCISNGIYPCKKCKKQICIKCGRCW